MARNTNPKGITIGDVVRAPKRAGSTRDENELWEVIAATPHGTATLRLVGGTANDTQGAALSALVKVGGK